MDEIKYPGCCCKASITNAQKEANYGSQNSSPFIGKKSGITRHRELPIYLRVTIDKKRFEVATQRHVDPSHWSTSGGRVKGKSDKAVETNMALDKASKKVYDYRDELYGKNGRVDPTRPWKNAFKS